MHRRFRCPVTVHLFVFRKDEVLLSRRANTGFGDGLYSVVAGCCEGGESVTAAMVREAREEAGILLDAPRLRFVHVMHRTTGPAWESVDFFFAIDGYEGEISNREPDKCADLAFFPRSALPENMVDYVRRALVDAFEARVFGEVGFDA